MGRLLALLPVAGPPVTAWRDGQHQPPARPHPRACCHTCRVTPTPTWTTPHPTAAVATRPAARTGTDSRDDHSTPRAGHRVSSLAPESARSGADSPHAGQEPAPGTGSARDQATRLIADLAADAVRREPRALLSPLDAAAPWARALPPAAWREFAAEAANALREEPTDRLTGLETVLQRWHDVAAHFS